MAVAETTADMAAVAIAVVAVASQVLQRKRSRGAVVVPMVSNTVAL